MYNHGIHWNSHIVMEKTSIVMDMARLIIIDTKKRIQYLSKHLDEEHSSFRNKKINL